MDARTTLTGAAGLAGLGAMYVEGLLLQQGVTTWGHLLVLLAGGLLGLGVALVAIGLIVRDLLRRG